MVAELCPLEELGEAWRLGARVELVSARSRYSNGASGRRGSPACASPRSMRAYAAMIARRRSGRCEGRRATRRAPATPPHHDGQAATGVGRLFALRPASTDNCPRPAHDDRISSQRCRALRRSCRRGKRPALRSFLRRIPLRTCCSSRRNRCSNPEFRMNQTMTAHRRHHKVAEEMRSQPRLRFPLVPETLREHVVDENFNIRSRRSRTSSRRSREGRRRARPRPPVSGLPHLRFPRPREAQ